MSQYNYYISILNELGRYGVVTSREHRLIGERILKKYVGKTPTSKNRR